MLPSRPATASGGFAALRQLEACQVVRPSSGVGHLLRFEAEHAAKHPGRFAALRRFEASQAEAAATDIGGFAGGGVWFTGTRTQTVRLPEDSFLTLLEVGGLAMANGYSLLKLAEIRYEEDLAAAELWRLASEVAPAGRADLRFRRRWLARLGGWLESLGCALQSRYQDMPASAGEAANAG